MDVLKTNSLMTSLVEPILSPSSIVPSSKIIYASIVFSLHKKTYQSSDM